MAPAVDAATRMTRLHLFHQPPSNLGLESDPDPLAWLALLIARV